jgi:soluble lytic murein transglycosylase-like protein
VKPERWIIAIIVLLIINTLSWSTLYILISRENDRLDKRIQDLNRDIKVINEVYGQAQKIREREKKYNTVDEETGRDIAYAIIYEARINHISPDLISAVVETEANFKPAARSEKNARSLMQMTRPAWKDHGRGNIDNWRDNLSGGVKYLAWLLQRFDGNERLALAAYNAGPSRPRGTILRLAADYPDRVNRCRWGRVH